MFHPAHTERRHAVVDLLPNIVYHYVCCIDVVIQEASMWTQKDVVAFKNAIKKESRMENHTDCIIKVGSGETVTVSHCLSLSSFLSLDI